VRERPVQSRSSRSLAAEARTLSGTLALSERERVALGLVTPSYLGLLVLDGVRRTAFGFEFEVTVSANCFVLGRGRERGSRWPRRHPTTQPAV
jgi:hypothetical protein